jgi:N-acetylglucosamine kinase-like BadF-type ATPase
MTADQLILGIDGGGSKTLAWLAVRPGGAPHVVGRGTAGPSNPQSIGFEACFNSLDRAVASAFLDASMEAGPVASAVLALAGSDREGNRRRLRQWADRCRLAHRFQVVHDALPVLAAGSPEGWGVALIAGTGSFAFGVSRDGCTARAGGWGYLFGDEGSGYAIALSGLRAAAKSADGRGPKSELTQAFCQELDLKQPSELIERVYSMASDRAAVAALAKTVTEVASQGDRVAWDIVDQAASELAAMVAAIVRRLDFARDDYPLALAGSAILASRDLMEQLQIHLGKAAVEPAKIAGVPDPVLGAVLLAEKQIAGE